MNLLTQIVHFAGAPSLGDLRSRISFLRVGLRPLHLRCIHLCLLFFGALLSPIQADDFQSGLDAYHESKYVEATAAFDRSLESSESAATHHNLALSLYQQGQAVAAVWQLERALRLAPLNKTYIFKLGALRQMLGLYDTPTTWWQSAANMLTKSTWIWIASSGFWIVIAVLCATLPGRLPAPYVYKALFRYSNRLPSLSSRCADDSNHAAAFRNCHFQRGCRPPPRSR